MNFSQNLYSLRSHFAKQTTLRSRPCVPMHPCGRVQRGTRFVVTKVCYSELSKTMFGFFVILLSFIQYRTLCTYRGTLKENRSQYTW